MMLLSGKISASMSTTRSSAVHLNNLGVRYHTEGKFRESDAAHKESSAILEAAGPENTPLLAKSLANRAALYRTFQEYHEAERLHGADGARLLREPPVPVFKIGECTDTGLWLEANGTRERLAPTGWVHRLSEPGA